MTKTSKRTANIHPIYGGGSGQPCRDGHRPGTYLSVFAAFLCLASAAFAATPPTPTQPTLSGGVTVSGKHYVNGPFTLSSYSAGVHHYKVCRSNDTTGWGGCNVVMTSNTGASYAVSGSNMPSNGYRRAYRFSACDADNNCTSWSANEAVYVQMDTTGPTAPGPTSTSCAYQASGYCWVTGNFIATVTLASDSGCGTGWYRWCRSHDKTGGFAGCASTITSNGSDSVCVYRRSRTPIPTNADTSGLWAESGSWLMECPR